MLGRNRPSGFTIVELLIVIVVIAVLAAVTVVAFNGVQQRAKNSQRIAAAKEWHKLIMAYTSANGAYPSVTINNHTCLGDHYVTNFDINADVDCYSTNNIKHPTAGILNAYRTIAPLPVFPNDTMTSVGGYGTVTGISIRAHDTLDPATTPQIQYPMLWYWLYGTSQDCVLRPVAQPVAGGYQQTTSTFSVNDGNYTRCVILLTAPGSL